MGPEGRTIAADREIAWAGSKACALGDGTSCYEAAYALDPATMLGGFVRELRSYEGARQLYEVACNQHKNNDACMSLMNDENLSF